MVKLVAHGGGAIDDFGRGFDYKGSGARIRIALNLSGVRFARRMKM